MTLRNPKDSPENLAGVQWCWMETERQMFKHSKDVVFGDPADCWIKYGDTANLLLESALQSGANGCTPLRGYYVDFWAMKQTKRTTGYQRDVQRIHDILEGTSNEVQEAPPVQSLAVHHQPGGFQTNKPKEGVGWIHGWMHEISIYYTIWWFTTTGLVTVAIVCSIVAKPPPCDNYCFNWLQIVGYVAAVLYGYAMLVLSCNSICGCNNTVNYFSNIHDPDSAHEILMKQKAATPKITLHVVCSHTETERYRDSDGEWKERTRTVVTYRSSTPVKLSSCVDVTEGLDDINLNEFRLTKIKNSNSFIPDQAFKDQKTAYYNANKHRDTECSVSEVVKYSMWASNILASVEGKDFRSSLRRQLLTPGVYFISQLLLYPALPYRIWLCAITGKIKLDFKKKITTDYASV